MSSRSSPKICFFTLSSILSLLLFLAGCKPVITPIVQNRQLRAFGTMGDDPGKFREPRQLTLTHRNTLLVGDFRNYRFQEMSLHGRPLQMWGRRGDAAGQFFDPTAAAMDSLGDVYGVDTWNHRVQKLNSETNQWNATWASTDFYAPRGIAIDREDRVYITNTSRHSILVFDTSGKRIGTWGNGHASPDTFHDPIGIAIGPDQNIYVADCGNARVKILNQKGELIRTIHVADWADGAFSEGYIALDSSGKIFVTSPNNHKVSVYTQEGTLYSRFGVYGSSPEHLNYPTGIAITENDLVVISDSMNHRIVTYTSPSALPDLEQRLHRHDQKVNIIRWIIDGIALVIIFLWVRRRIVQHPFQNKFKWITQLKHHPCGCRVLFVLGIISSFSAMIALKYGFFIHISASILLVSLFLMILGFQSAKYPPTSLHTPLHRSRYLHRIMLLVVILLAIGLRFHRLETIPSGINNDAAWNALYAHRILEGEPYTPFTDEAWGKETFYFYLIALSLKLFGSSTISLYLPCILAGILTTVSLYFLCRHLWNRDIALISTTAYAVMAWNLTFSRTGYRAVLAPLFLALTGYFFYKAVDSSTMRSRLSCYAAAGIAIGGGLHTYFSFRGIPLMMILIGIHTWITTPRFMRKNWLGLLIMQLFAWVVFLPLVLYAIKDPHSFLGRSSFLFVGNKVKSAASLKPLWDNVIGNLQIFHYKADVGNFFEPLHPIVSFPVGFFMLIGLAYTIRHWKTRGGFWILMLSFFGILPGFLSEPDATRLILLTIMVASAFGLGVHQLIDFFTNIRFLQKPKILPVILLTTVLVLTAITEYHLYFHVLANSRHAQFGYAPIHTTIGRKAAELSEKYHVYISNSHFLDTPKFLCYAIPGDVFAITKGREIDFITTEELNDQLDMIRKKAHSPDKGIAFVMDHYEKNLYIKSRIEKLWPGIHSETFFDEIHDSSRPPLYYVLTLSNSMSTDEAFTGGSAR